MADQTDDVIGGFNTYVKEMKAQALVDGIETVVSLFTFADDHSVVYGAKPVKEVQPLTEKNYRTYGNTALLDAVYDSVTKYREKVGQGEYSPRKQSEAPSVLVIIFTDGEENASRHATWHMVQKLIKSCEKLGNWQFTYAGAHASAWAQSQKMGIRVDQTVDAQHLTFDQTTRQLLDRSLSHRSNLRP